MSGRWADAAFVQERLVSQLHGKWEWRKQLEGVQGNLFPDYPEGMLVGLHEFMLGNADPMYVADHIVELWDFARPSFSPEVLHAWDLPTPIGFALMANPLAILSYGVKLTFRAFSWCVVTPESEVGWSEDNEPTSCWFSLYSHIDDEDDFRRPDHMAMERQAWERLGPWICLHTHQLPLSEPFGPTLVITDPGGDDVSIEQAHQMTGRPSEDRLMWQTLQSFWRLTRQLVPVRSPLPRQLRRDRARKGRSSEVTVIHLRRPRSQVDGVEPTRRIGEDFHFVVRGFWRKQPYGPRNNRTYKQIWINPYMKGNLEAPLKMGKRAFEFDR